MQTGTIWYTHWWRIIMFLFSFQIQTGNMGRAMRKRDLGRMRTANAQNILRIHAVWSGPSLPLTVIAFYACSKTPFCLARPIYYFRNYLRRAGVSIWGCFVKCVCIWRTSVFFQFYGVLSGVIHNYSAPTFLLFKVTLLQQRTVLLVTQWNKTWEVLCRMNVAMWVLLIQKRNEQFSRRSPNLAIRPEMSLLLSIFVHVWFFSFRFFFRRTTRKKKQKIFFFVYDWKYAFSNRTDYKLV